MITEDPKSAEIIRLILRGRDISRYGYKFADLWLVVTHNGMREHNVQPIDVNCYPAIKAHLDQYYDKISKRADKGDTPYNLRNCAYMDDFSKQKIVYAETMRVHKGADDERFPRFTLIEDEYYLDKTCFMITGDELPFILGIINSSVINYYIHKNVAVLDTGGFLMQKIYIENFPIPVASERQKKELSSIVSKLLRESNAQQIDRLEKDVDEMVLQLYGISAEEADYIKSCCKDHQR